MRSALAHAGGHQLVDVRIALVGDDGLRIVVHLGLAGLDRFLDGVPDALRQGQLGENLLVALEELDGGPAGQVRRHDAALVPGAVRVVVVLRLLPVAVGDEVLDVRQRVLHAAVKDVQRLTVAALLRERCGLLRRVHAALAPERRGLHHLTAQRRAELLHVDPVAVLAGDIDHVQRDDHRDAQLGELRGQVEVALDVRRVHDVEDRVRLFIHQIAAGDDLLQRVGGEGVDARQVLNDDVLRAAQPALLLFDRHARPVAHILVAAGEVVEHGGLSAIRVARQGNLDRHRFASFIC